MASPTFRSSSLCHSCAFAKNVHGRGENVYFLCRNDKVNVRYPRQPVITCAGFEQRDNRPQTEPSADA